jgi:hypothetical protein
MEGLNLGQLVELENILHLSFLLSSPLPCYKDEICDTCLHLHHEGLRRVSQRRQEHMQKELEVLRKEKEALQEKQMCIVSSTIFHPPLFLLIISFHHSNEFLTSSRFALSDHAIVCCFLVGIVPCVPRAVLF